MNHQISWSKFVFCSAEELELSIWINNQNGGLAIASILFSMLIAIVRMKFVSFHGKKQWNFDVTEQRKM